jgi:hypothetical protein
MLLCQCCFQFPQFATWCLCLAAAAFRLYEEVEPACILDERPAASGEGREFLVQYMVRGAVAASGARVEAGRVGIPLLVVAEWWSSVGGPGAGVRVSWWG